MLKKLLRYDLVGIFKYLGFFYGVTLFLGVFTRIFGEFANSFIMNLIGKVASIGVILMMVSVVINNIMRLWIRFKQNLYGDESYLTHTLPVERKTLYLSKMIGAISSLLVSVLVIGLTLVVVYYSKDNLAILKSLILPVANLYDSTVVTFLVGVFGIFFLEMVNLLQIGWSGIILGHRMNTNKVRNSVIFGFLIYIIGQLIVLGVVFGIALIDSDIMNLFVTNEVVGDSALKQIMIIAMFIYSLEIVVCYNINIKLLKKGVDVL